MSKPYYFKFSNRLKMFCSAEIADAYCKEKGVSIIAMSENSLSPNTIRPKKHDSFQPGYHPGAGRVFNTKNEYEAFKKETGTVEMGNDMPIIKNENKKAPMSIDDGKNIKEDLKIASDDMKSVEAILNGI